MKKLFIFLFLIYPYLLYGQPSIQWQKCLGGSLSDRIYSIQQTTDGGYIVSGRSGSNDGDIIGNHGNDDFWVVKLDNVGAIQWQKCLGGTLIDGGYSIQQTTDGGYIVAGWSVSNDGDVTGNHGNSDYWVVKLDSVGIIQWQKCLGGTGDDTGHTIQQTTDGGYIVIGTSDSNNGDVTGNHGARECWIVKLDSIGLIQWQKCLGGTSNEEGLFIQQTTDGGYIVTAWTGSNDGDVIGNHGNDDCWIVKLDYLGTIQWQKCLGGTLADAGYSTLQTSDGGYIVVGYSYSNDGDVTGNHGYEDYWIVKLDSFGAIQWQKCLGGTLYDEGHSIQQTTDGGYIVSGRSGSNDGDIIGNHGNDDFWIMKLDSVGTIQWQKCLGGTGSDVTFYIRKTTDGGYIVAGWSYSNNGDITGNHGYEDYWIIKLNPTIGINEIQNSIVGFQIIPNPISNNTLISFSLSSMENIEIIITDIEGRLVKNLCPIILRSGTNELTWDATDNEGSKVKEGAYFITILSNISTTSKMVLLNNK